MSASGGFGVQLQIDDTGLTAIVDVLEMDMPEFTKVIADATAHDSAGGYAEHVATGRFDIGAFTATLAWDDTEATHVLVLAAFDSTSPVNMGVISPDGGETITFSAHVTRIGRMAAQNEVYKAEVEIQPTGQATIA